MRAQVNPEHSPITIWDTKRVEDTLMSRPSLSLFFPGLGSVVFRRDGRIVPALGQFHPLSVPNNRQEGMAVEQRERSRARDRQSC